MSAQKIEIVDFIVNRVSGKTLSAANLPLSQTYIPSAEIDDIVFMLEDRLDVSIPYFANARSRAASSVRTVGHLERLVRRLLAEHREREDCAAALVQRLMSRTSDSGSHSQNMA